MLISQRFIDFYWRRLSESDRSSEFCRLVPYRLAKAPHIKLYAHNKKIVHKNGAVNENRTRNLTLARGRSYVFTTLNNVI